MDFQTKGLGLGEAGLVDPHRIHGGLSQPDVRRVEGNAGWFDFGETRDDASDFVVRESMPNNAYVGNGDVSDALPHLA